MKQFSLISFFLFAAFGILSAQSDTLKTKLDEVVITATRTETPLREVANSISVVSSEEMRQRLQPTASAYLNGVNGLFIPSQGGYGSLANIFTRGGGSQHTLVLLNGIKMNDPSSPSNSYDFSNLLSDNIERIEILRGPQSTLYGSDAMAGVVNIITKRPASRPAVNLSLETGSNNLYRGNLSAVGKVNRLSWLFNYSRLQTDGISAISEKYGAKEKDGYRNNTIYAALGYDLSKQSKLNLFYNLQKGEADLDRSGEFGDDPNYKYYTENQNFKAEGDLNLFGGKWKQQLSVSFMKVIGKAENKFDAADSNYSRNYSNAGRIEAKWQNTLNLIDKNEIILGAEFERESASGDYNADGVWGPYSSVSPREKANTFGVYAQDQIKYFENFFAAVGVRYDNHSRFGGVFTYRIAPAYLIPATGTKLKASYGSGFKSPSLFNLYDPMFGNRDLLPEKNTGWDAGFEQYLMNDKLMFGAAYFYSDYNDLIAFDPATYKPMNIDKSESKGFELTAELNGLFGFDIKAGYTYTDARDKSEGTDKDLPLIRRPQNQAGVNINYNWDSNLNLNLNYRFVGERFDMDFGVFPASRVSLKSYSLVDFAVTYRAIKYLKFYARIDNLLDEKYEDVLYYGTLGRSFYVGVKINLGL